jgi:hypothetical protein
MALVRVEDMTVYKTLTFDRAELKIMVKISGSTTTSRASRHAEYDTPWRRYIGGLPGVFAARKSAEDAARTRRSGDVRFLNMLPQSVAAILLWASGIR